MSYFKIILFFLAFILLQGCGFRPIHSNNDQNKILDFSKVTVNPIPNRSGQILWNQLQSGGHPKGHRTKPIYSLDVDLTEHTNSLAVRKSAFATRANLIINTKFKLSRIQDKKSVYSDNYSITVSYNILDTEYATLAAKKNALKNGLFEVSQGIRTRLEFYFSRIQN